PARGGGQFHRATHHLSSPVYGGEPAPDLIRGGSPRQRRDGRGAAPSAHPSESARHSVMKNLALPPDPSPFKPAAQLVAPKLVEAHQTWRDIAGARFAPQRREIAPARFKPALSNLFLVEVVNKRDDFRLALS